MDTTNIADQATATTALRKVRDDLAKAIDRADDTTGALRAAIVTARPAGILTVDQIADAIGRDRNFVDTTWSDYGQSTRNKQTRVAIQDVDDATHAAAVKTLSDAAWDHRRAHNDVNTLRAERDRVVAMVYASKLLGPSAISREVGIDRNHVLRVARKAGVAPMHRTNSKNQYSAAAK